MKGLRTLFKPHYLVKLVSCRNESGGDLGAGKIILLFAVVDDLNAVL